MTTNYDFFIGIDVSKLTLDTGLIYQKELFAQNVIINDKEAIREWLHGLGVDFGRLLICAEHTGKYSDPLVAVAVELGIDIWLVNPLHLNRSLGLQRGKNDKVDADRIAKFAFRFQDEAQLYSPPTEQVEKLKALVAMRSRLVKAIHLFKMPMKEMKDMKLAIEETVSASSDSILNKLEHELLIIDAAIDQTIKSNERTSRMLKQLDSIPGIGKVVGTAMLITTEMFTKFSDGRKYACYTGVAPFEHSSGTSVRGKTKVSHMASKDMKKLLHLAAMAAISGNNEFSRYYHARAEDKKTGRKGKNKMSVLNAVRNKIIHTAFALIKNDTMYQKNFKDSLVNP